MVGATYLSIRSLHGIAIGISSLILSVSAALLIFDCQSPPPSLLVEVGRATQIQGDVKRSTVSRSTWISLSPHQILHVNDKVQAFPGGSTVLRLNHSDGALVDEKTILSIESLRENTLTLNLLSGSTTFLLESGETVIRFGNVLISGKGVVWVQGGSNNESTISSLRGDIKITRLDETIHLKENHFIHFGRLPEQLSELENRAFPFQLLSPTANQLVTLKSDKQPVVMRWAKSPQMESSPARLQVSTHRDFRQTEHTQALGDQDSYSLSLPVGHYYWRVVDEDENSLSPTLSFDVRRLESIRPITPVSERLFTFFRTPPKVVFQWVLPEYVSSVELQLAKDPEFSTLEWSRPLQRETRLVALVETPGIYYWRVLGNAFSLPKKQISQIRSFRVRKQNKLNPPYLLQPKPGQSIRAPQQRAKQTVGFRWEKSNSERLYLLEISRTSDFSTILVSRKTTGSFANIELEGVGQYYWRVSVFDSENQVVTAHDPRSFIITKTSALKLIHPKNAKRFKYAKKVPRVFLKWKKSKKAEYYRIDLARDIDFRSEIEKYTTQKTSILLKNLTDGTYFWRVQAIDRSTQPYRVSRVQFFVVEPNDLLAAPTLLKPVRGHTELVYTAEDVELLFKWKPQKGAKEYEFVIIQNNEHPTQVSKPIEVKKLTVNTPFIKINRLPTGRYLWFVRGVDKNGRRGSMSGKRSLEVSNTDIIAPPSDVEIEVTK